MKPEEFNPPCGYGPPTSAVSTKVDLHLDFSPVPTNNSERNRPKVLRIRQLVVSANDLGASQVQELLYVFN